MKLAFSTIGCPGLDWAETCRLAREQGFAGFEVRDLGPRTLTYDKFTNSNKAATRAELESQGLRLTCFSIGRGLRGEAPDIHGNLLDPKTAQMARETARHYIKMAAGLGCPYVRLQIDDYFKDPNQEDAIVLDALEELVPFADVLGVTLLVETKGVYSDTQRLCTLLARFRSNAVGALWDVDHTSHSGGENPARTVENLGGLIKYVHLRDSRARGDNKADYRQGGAAYQNDQGGPLRMGEGDVPLREAMLALRSIDFGGVLCFEWRGQIPPRKKKDTDSAAFMKQAAEPFQDFASYMVGRYADLLDPHTQTFDNLRRDGGKYFWPKNTIIEATLPQVLDRVCQSFPDQIAFHYNSLEQASDYYRKQVRPQGYRVTYSAFREDVNIFARALIALGVCKGDKVAIWCPNLPEWYITFWAAVKIGAVLVTVNTAYKDREAEYLLRQSDTRLLVMADGVKDSDYRAVVHRICPELRAMGESGAKDLYSEKFPILRNIITIESEQPGCMTWKEAVGKASDVDEALFAARTSELDARDVCNMQYTSGTTGFPKGVMLTHYNIVNNGKSIGDGMDLSTADRMMIQVPMFHCFGMVLAMTAAMTHGTSMYPIPVFSPRLGLKCVHEERITAFHGVPTMFIAMLNHEDFDKTDFSHVRTGIMAGSPCPIKVMRDVLTRMRMSEVTIVFGQTESSPGCTMSRTTDSIETRVNTVGSAFFGVECKIVDPETGADLPDGADGEFCARGYNIMKGYYKMPEATAAAIDADGWLHTGDLARRDAEGNYKITGRIKDMIIRGGENIYPKEIEDFIYTHPKVSDVQVVGVPSRAYGEEIMAWIILKPGEAATQEEIKDFVLASMAKHKCPRYVHFTDGFPMNAAGKIMKYKMREAAVELLGLQGESRIVTA